ncbi:cell wall hydrolase [Brevundimonas sp. AAP58]|uniref:cell wall hydrolase n=1 Tax=Brevundimonas sp. AAP58 TaxID=1523422 RepID=UPI0006B8AF13|nr:cell wall hydrolase [Brevundimonas sp. AAP58]
MRLNPASLVLRLGRAVRGHRLLAVAPAVLAAFGVAVAASSAARPDVERTAEGIARLTGGDWTQAGLLAVSSRMDAAQIALAARFDPNAPRPTPLGLTPGWESLRLAGKPGFELGASGRDAQRLNAAMPAAIGALRPARPFAFTPASAADRNRALRCLTQGIYYEAALESTEGQEAVAQVILNRVRDPNYPNTICGVVFEGAERVTGCQFSFTCDGSLAQQPVAWAWDRARIVAERALAGHVATEVGTATHYHADYVHPWWAPTLGKITQIGAHIFYRWKGLAGETAAFQQRYSGHEPIIDEARFARPRLRSPELQLALDVGASDAEVLADGGMNLRTVEIDGRTRVVGVASLGGRRPPSPEQIAEINARLAAFEAPAPAQPVIPPPPGVVTMDVEEVGRPAS